MLELVGVNYNAVKLFQKVLLIIQYHIAIGYGIRKESYRDKLHILGGTDQENSASGVICGDTLYLIFKYLEKQKLGAEINITSEKQMIQRVATTFVNDTDI